VLVTEVDGRPAPKVIDFGVAKAVGLRLTEETLTSGQVLGTPAYMSPEQALGDVEHLDRRSDVFGLGAILCEILTGEPPYREAGGDLVRQASAGAIEGALERLETCGADPALVSLCGECLARARRARPESAAEVAERVGAYLTSVEERAREAELRAAEARYRSRTTMLAAGAGLVIVLLGAGAWIWNANEAETRRAEAMQRVAAAMSAASGARGRAQEAGLDAARVTGDQFAVAMRALLPVALASRGVGDVDRVCDRLVLLADGLGGGTASADSPEAMFGRFGR